ncbi:hypothetical protein [Clostridium septicum]|nr:hypothetical protein [Clostridium septicum]
MFGEESILQFISAMNTNRLVVDTLNINENNEFFNDRLIEEFLIR